MKRLLCHAELVGLPNTEEFTFRSMFMSEAATAVGNLRFQTEWNKFDLLVQSDDNPVLIEFKYYLLRRTIGLEGAVLGIKGGAGKKNEAEFWKCVDKLATQPDSSIKDRFLVLVYEREYDKASSHSFHSSYGTLTATGQIADIWEQSVGPLEGRVLRIEPH